LMSDIRAPSPSLLSLECPSARRLQLGIERVLTGSKALRARQCQRLEVGSFLDRGRYIRTALASGRFLIIVGSMHGGVSLG
jgi:hypothetical protein